MQTAATIAAAIVAQRDRPTPTTPNNPPTAKSANYSLTPGWQNGAPPNGKPPTNPTPTSEPCICGGAGWYVPDLPLGHAGFGRAIRCAGCDPSLGKFCGLTESERALTAASITAATDQEKAQRWLAETVPNNPTGWLTLYGPFGTAKTLTVQVIIAEMVRRKKSARFYRASQIQQGWFDDFDEDKDNATLYRNLPVLAIDELDKVNLKNDWIRQQFQELLDYRYRMAIDGKQLTLITVQGNPHDLLPGDIASRMDDGRFYREWAGSKNKLVIDRWGMRVLPGCLAVTGEDARPFVAPKWLRKDAAHAT